MDKSNRGCDRAAFAHVRLSNCLEHVRTVGTERERERWRERQGDRNDMGLYLDQYTQS